MRVVMLFVRYSYDYDFVCQRIASYFILVHCTAMIT